MYFFNSLYFLVHHHSLLLPGLCSCPYTPFPVLACVSFLSWTSCPWTFVLLTLDLLRFRSLDLDRFLCLDLLRDRDRLDFDFSTDRDRFLVLTGPQTDLSLIDGHLSVQLCRLHLRT